MTEIPGVDTIMGLVGTPPNRVDISYQILEVTEKLRQICNAKFMAIIPYCFVCKEPLVWHSPPDKDNILFHCPKCKREWVKDKEWIAKEKSE